jgi:O-antigen/teichoic acid export membrane protein
MEISKSLKIKNLRNISEHIKWSWLNSLVGPISTQIDKWIVAIIATTSALSSYYLAVVIFEGVISIISASISWLYPRSAASSGEVYEKQKYYIKKRR